MSYVVIVVLHGCDGITWRFSISFPRKSLPKNKILSLFINCSKVWVELGGLDKSFLINTFIIYIYLFIIEFIKSDNILLNSSVLPFIWLKPAWLKEMRNSGKVSVVLDFHYMDKNIIKKN